MTYMITIDNGKPFFTNFFNCLKISIISNEKKNILKLENKFKEIFVKFHPILNNHFISVTFDELNNKKENNSYAVTMFKYEENKEMSLYASLLEFELYNLKDEYL